MLDYGKIRERTLFDIYPRGQSIMMTKCVAEQILGKRLEKISIYPENYPLDIEAFKEVELNDLKHFCIIPFESSKEKQPIEFNVNWTLSTKFVIIGKTLTSNERTVFLEIFGCVM